MPAASYSSPAAHAGRVTGGWRRHLSSLALCAALAVLHTWPLASDLAGLSRFDNADANLNTWIVSWVAQELPRHPTQVFDAPMFHPERRTLAYSENLLAQGAMAVPLRAAGLAPTTIYNLDVLIGLTLSAWAMWWLVAGWTGEAWAGALAGMAFAFNAHTLTRFGQIQGLHLEFVPLVFLGIDRVATECRRRDGLLLGLGLALVGLCSLYLFVFLTGAAGVALMARAPEWRPRARATARVFLLGLVTAGVLLAPMLFPYWAVNHELGLVRSLDEVTYYSATWRDYLATSARWHYEHWSAPFHTSATSLFPGLGVLALASIGVVRRPAHHGRVSMLVAIAAFGVVMSFGTALPTYQWLYALVPLVRAVRVASRWGGLWLMALAALAGLGLAALRAASSGRTRLAVSVLAVLVVTGEALRAPMGFVPTPAVPAVYAELARLHDAVLVELPIYPSVNFSLNAPYLMAQITHGQRIVNGYSGFATSDYEARAQALQTFPDEAAHAVLHDLGVTHVVVHVDRYRDPADQAMLARLDDVPWLHRTFGDGQARVFAVTP